MKITLILFALLLTACGSEEQTNCFTLTPTGNVYDQKGNYITTVDQLTDAESGVPVCN